MDDLKGKYNKVSMKGKYKRQIEKDYKLYMPPLSIILIKIVLRKISALKF